jgi:hypothetical protein
VILGCGPDAARAYPYTVAADGTETAIKVAAPDHPLTMAMRPDGSLDAGSGPYQVHGRKITGKDSNDDFTFAPLEQTCSLAVLTPAKAIPAGNSGTKSAGGIRRSGRSYNLRSCQSYDHFRIRHATRRLKSAGRAPLRAAERRHWQRAGQGRNSSAGGHIAIPRGGQRLRQPHARVPEGVGRCPAWLGRAGPEQ